MAEYYVSQKDRGVGLDFYRKKKEEEARNAQPRFGISAAGKAQGKQILENMGLNLKPGNGILKPIEKPESMMPPDGKQKVMIDTPRPQPDPEPIPETYVDPAPAKLGFNPAGQAKNYNNPAMPIAPMRSSADEEMRRKALRDASTPHKGSQNGQLTIGQMQLRAGILGSEDKMNTDRYGAQLGAASQLAQAQMSQDGTNERLNTQLGFDANKFQQTAIQQQELNDMSRERLGMEKAASEIQNYGPKKINSLYEQYDAAQSDEDRLKISEKLKTLQGGDKERYVAISGGESLGPDGMTATKNPDVLLDIYSGVTKQQPKAAPSLSDPVMLKLQQSGKYSQKELEEIVGIHMAGGDVSGYLG